MSAGTRPAGLPTSLDGLGRTLVMGVLNVTADSFSDGGRYLDPAAALRHGRAMRESGADIIDVGGESTRPGATRIPTDEEQARVLPVIRSLSADGIPVSVDTMNADTARRAVDAGAVIVNDVSGGLADPAMLAVVAGLETVFVCMHWRGWSERMDDFADYDDVVAEVCRELASRLRACEDTGVDPARVVLDPGIGFAKHAEHNWALLRGLDELGSLGHPLLVGASRKRFLGSLLADPATNEPRAMDDRDVATAAVTALAAASGVWAVRVHDVRANRDAVEVGRAWRTGEST
jgi:dihydropteroate synthase